MNDYLKQGWVRFYRKSVDSTVWSNPIVWMVWSWCLLKASHENKKIKFNGQDLEILKGSFVTGTNKSLEELPIPRQSYRTSIKYLKSTNRILTHSTNKFTIITIVNWSLYQNIDPTLTSKKHKELTNHQPATNQPLTTYKNVIREEDTHISPAASVILSNKNTTVRKNSFKYNEGNHTDHFETVIDADTGEVSNAPKSNASHLMKELLEWAAKRRGSPFVNLGKQYKAMAVMRRAGKNPSDIKNRWTELEKDDFFKKRGFDFMDLANSFDRK